jgi:hypothetical protein
MSYAATSSYTLDEGEEGEEPNRYKSNKGDRQK